MSGFQSTVNTAPAPGVAGDFCDANPRYTVDAGPGGFVAGSLGVYVGRFAWAQGYPLDPNSSPTVVNYFGTGQVTGFVHREQQALIVDYLAPASMKVPQGFPVTLFSGGGFWALNSGSGEVTRGMKAYATFGSGLVTFAATGSPTTAPSCTGAIAAGTASVTGSIADDVLTVTAVGSGTLVVGGTLSGTGVASGTMIVSQIDGTTGDVGTYAVNIPGQSVDSTTISETYGTFTAGATTGGSWTVGTVLSGSGVTAGTYITALGTGLGGAGTYIVTPTQTAGSTTITGAINVETKWYAMSAGPAGSLIKISDKPLG